MDIRSPSPYKLDGLGGDLSRYQVSKAWDRPIAISLFASKPEGTVSLNRDLILGGHGEDGSAIAFVLAQYRPRHSDHLIGQRYDDHVLMFAS
jgi:hypothetical protein